MANSCVRRSEKQKNVKECKQNEKKKPIEIIFLFKRLNSDCIKLY